MIVEIRGIGEIPVGEVSGWGNYCRRYYLGEVGVGEVVLGILSAYLYRVTYTSISPRIPHFNDFLVILMNYNQKTFSFYSNIGFISIGLMIDWSTVRLD